jgi:hypothetical protein
MAQNTRDLNLFSNHVPVLGRKEKKQNSGCFHFNLKPCNFPHLENRAIHLVMLEKILLVLRWDVFFAGFQNPIHQRFQVLFRFGFLERH